ncbi:MAG: trypsin-like peptidase domain-containing protein [Cyclobacteriaceae bacterium]
MNRRTLIISMVFSSIFGGIIVLAGYSLIAPKPTIIQQTSERNPLALTNYVFDSSDFIVPEGLNFVFAAKNATPSVVHIRTKYSGSEGSKNAFNDLFREYFGDRYEGQERESRGAGSGVVISSDGYIVTNNHVVENATGIEVVLNDNRSYEAKVIGVDASTDIAVIKIDEDNLQPLKYGSSEDIQIGEWVLAIGNPFEFRSTVTAGIVSAKSRNIGILDRRSAYRIESFIQTDAAVNPGNSGGALVNLNGELIGINTAIASPSGSFAGYSFAVPSSLVSKVVDDLVEYGTVQRALLGISIQDVTAELAEVEELDVVKGVYIGGVGENSAAEAAGLVRGDVIISIDNAAVNSVAELQEQVAINRPGDEVVVGFIRNGERKVANAVLRNSSGTTEIVELVSDFDSEGATFTEISNELASALNLDGGVQLSELRNGKWRDAGISKGFIITKIDKQKINNLEDLRSFLREPKSDGILIEGMYPNGNKAFYGLGL